MDRILGKKPAAVLTALLCVGLWGTAFPLIKLGYHEFGIGDGVASKLVFAGERFALAGLIVFLAGSVFSRRALVLRRCDVLPVAALGAVQIFIQYLCSYIGVGATTATNTSIITGSGSVISVILAAWFFRNDRLTLLKAIGCVAGFAGVAAVNFSNVSLSGELMFGNIMVLLSALAGSFGNIMTKLVSRGRNAMTVSAWYLLIGGAMLFAVGVTLGGSVDLSRLSGVMILLWLALVSSVSFMLWTALLRLHPVSSVSVFTLLVPVFGTVWSGIILGEDIFRTEILVSLVLICAGILLVNLTPKE